MGIIKMKNNVNAAEEAVQPAAAQPARETEGAAVGEFAGALYEMQDKRSENSKIYQMNDGTAKQIVASNPLHYRDETTGKMLPVDNKLTERENVFSSSYGPYKVEAAKYADAGKILSFGKADLGLEWTYLPKTAAAPRTAAVAAAARNPRAEDGEITYGNIEDGVDLRYEMLGTNLKENIIVRAPQEDYKFSFRLKTTNLGMKLSEDNRNIELFSQRGEGKKEKKEFTIPSPFMFDANGETSDDVYYELEPESDGTYLFHVVADGEWFAEEGRAFPVTVDPQIITDSTSLISKQVQCRSMSSSSGDSWDDRSSSYIKVSKNPAMEYRTVITVKKSNMPDIDGSVIGAKLILYPVTVRTAGTIYFNGNIDYTGGPLEQDITADFKNSGGNFNVYLQPSNDFVDVDFYADGSEAPVLEVEYLTNENTRSVKKTFSVAGAMIGQLDPATGEMTVKFTDITAENSVMGMEIGHVYKRSGETFSMGEDFRLNLHEKFVKKSGGDIDATYIYTDAEGEKHGFKDYYYYLNDGNKKTFVEKSAVTVEPDGTLSYTTGGTKYGVTAEYRTAAGVKAVTVLEGMKNAELLEQRSDEQKQLENEVEAYKNALMDYVVVNISDGMITKRFSESTLKSENFKNFVNIGSAQMILSKSEALNYRSMKIQYESLINQKSSVSLQEEAMKYQIEGMQYQLNSFDIQLSGNALSQEDAKDNWDRYYASLNQNINDQKGLTSRQKSNVTKQYGEFAETKSYLQSVDQNTREQIDAVTEKKNQYIKQIKTYYKEYCGKVYELEQFGMQLPVNLLTDGTIIKGFNKFGELVAVYDKFENGTYIEYEKYTIKNSEKRRIKRVYDGEEKQILFSYNKKDQLVSITDARGRKTCYAYTDGRLSKITLPGGKNLSLSYSSERLSSVVSDDKLQSTFSYSGNKLCETALVSTAGRITKEGAAGSGAQIETVSVAYVSGADGKIDSATIEQDRNKEKYLFDANGSPSAHYVEENGVVTSAEQYEYVPYYVGTTVQSNPRTVERKAAESCLYSAPLASFVFAAGETVTVTLDQFNNPVKKTVSPTKLTENGSNMLSSVTDYVYDDAQRAVREKTTVTTTSPATSFVSFVDYYYNALGLLVRKESYTEGEELTKGKTVEETVYDSKGNVVKSFTYNSLDTSSKFYSESEYAENGKLLADYDETGENKTEYEYIEGTNIVKTEKYPNGGKLSYGCDLDDNVSAITQSTEEGVENSTQKTYTCGLLTELRSGGNVVNYEYDHKRRKTAVKLNGTTHATINYSADDEAEKYVQVFDANGGVLMLYKDNAGNVTKSQFMGGTMTECTYNSKNQLTALSDGFSSDRVTVTYDGLDRQKTYASTNFTSTNSYDDFGNVSSVTQSGEGARTYTYAYKDNAARDLESITTGVYKFSPQTDKLGRNAGREISNNAVKVAGEYIYYRKVGDHATNMPSSVRYGRKQGDKFLIVEGAKYAYDKVGNIEKIFENGELTVRYAYDALSRLVREDNRKLQKTYLYEYDNNGNILCRRETEFTLSSNVEEKSFTTYNYTYMGDRVMSYNGTEFAYDALGNPTTYRGYAATWDVGRYLQTYKDTRFSYDGRGRRSAKGEIKFNYDANDRLIKQSDGLEFIYDASGVAGVVYQGNTYFYQKDIFNNITKILDENGSIIVQYTYDAWGNHAVLDGNGQEIGDAAHIGNKNPFRYRSYYFDTETGLYYLKSRYYDPEICRFITIDNISYIDPETINGLNLYAYCLNNPVNMYDENGDMPKWLSWLLVGIVAIAAIAAIVVGTVVTGGIAGGLVSAALIGVGTGALSGMAGSVISQGVTQGWNNINPEKVLISGGIGAVIGLVSGVASWSFSVIGSTYGNILGTALSGKTFWGETIGKIISVQFLSNAGRFIGGFIGGIAGGVLIDVLSNQIFNEEQNILESLKENFFGEIFSRLINQLF